MAPIPVHTASPINKNVPSDTLPDTSPSAAALRYTPPANAEARPTTTTTTQQQQRGSSYYPAARPGAAAVPQSTNAASATYNGRLQPTLMAETTTSTTLTPTPTRTTATKAPSSNDDNSPPSPQPGAVPSAAADYTLTPTTLSLPQPPPMPMPVPGPQPHPHAQHAPSPSSPSLMTQSSSPVRRHALPSPTPTRTSYPVVPFPSAYPPPGQQDLSHPPGYVQDSRASFDDKPVEECQPYENRASPSSSSSSAGRRGILDSEPVFDSRAESDSLLNTAMSWAKAAGKRLSKTEQEIWRHVNGEN
ncbi:hypothetical protein PV08_08571 [Exophiala spinifera]|uniref:Uncharacterized protein n=1 Tax=Exophiala spinifera TaxID=91928 RepID=A0A0D2B396_9EURO|nr:uncharacterized protein PV08_08571 [Exophiala spinifera]KIW13383.1 hypothetical protein PV08_08571 [Exophiala spinifera]